MKPMTWIAVLALTTAVSAQAQMMGRGPGMGTPAMPGRGGVGGAGRSLTMGAMHLTVAPDGTALTIDRRYDAASKTFAEKLVAWNATGTRAWEFDTTGGAHAFEIVGAHVVLSTARMPMMGNGPATDSDLVALNLSDGKVAWRLKLDGVAMSIEPAASQIYVLIVKPSGSAPLGVFGAMMAGDRTLVAVNSSGVILWSRPLGQ